MRNSVFIVLLLLMPFWCGCARVTYEQYQVKVVDAEQGIPVEGAKVFVGYIRKFPTPPIEVMTDRSGLAELNVEKSMGWCLNISADGYAPFGLPSDQRGQDILDRQDIVIQSGTEFVVAIYKKPEPKVEIIVPDGYRGTVTLEALSTHKPIQGEPVQRVFSQRMMPDGLVSVQASPIFYSIHKDSITVRYESGNAIPIARHAQNPDLVSLRLLHGYGLEWLFIVGTEKDVDNWVLDRIRGSH